MKFTISFNLINISFNFFIDCRENEFQCHDGTCVNKDNVCDGQADCTEAEDEQNCGK